MIKYCRLLSPLCLLTMVIAGISSCKDASNLLLPASSGRPFEVMVVCNNDTWNRIAGRAIFHALDMDIPGLPQPEPAFRVSQIDSSGFNQITNIFRNIIIVNINPALYTETKIRYQRNVYAEGQVIMFINAPSEEDLTTAMSHNAKAITDFFTKSEFGREVSLLADHHNIAAEKSAISKFGWRLWIPKEITATKKGRDFLWFSNNTATGMQNFCIYSYPYDGHDITRNTFTAKRDSIMGANIPGEQPGMFMQTTTASVIFKRMSRKTMPCYVARGLWEMKNDCMGGPFVSHSYIDTKHRRVVVAEAFVYAPESKKRILMRTLEGALYTFKQNLK